MFLLCFITLICLMVTLKRFPFSDRQARRTVVASWSLSCGMVYSHLTLSCDISRDSKPGQSVNLVKLRLTHGIN